MKNVNQKIAKQSDGLSTAEVAGIAIGTVAGVALIGAVITKATRVVKSSTTAANANTTVEVEGGNPLVNSAVNGTAGYVAHSSTSSLSVDATTRVWNWEIVKYRMVVCVTCYFV